MNQSGSHRNLNCRLTGNGFPLFPDVRQILHIVQRLVLPNALKVSGTGLPRFDRWPQLNQQQQTNLLFAELGMTPSSDDDAPPKMPEFQRPASDDDSKPPKAPEFIQNDSNDDSNDSESPPIFKTPPPSKSGRTESPLEKHPRSQIIHTLTHTHTHTCTPRSTRDVALLGTVEVIRKQPSVLAFSSN
jgi:hypothetical protein